MSQIHSYQQQKLNRHFCKQNHKTFKINETNHLEWQGQYFSGVLHFISQYLLGRLKFIDQYLLGKLKFIGQYLPGKLKFIGHYLPEKLKFIGQYLPGKLQFVSQHLPGKLQFINWISSNAISPRTEVDLLALNATWKKKQKMYMSNRIFIFLML